MTYNPTSKSIHTCMCVRVIKAMDKALASFLDKKKNHDKFNTIMIYYNSKKVLDRKGA